MSVFYGWKISGLAMGGNFMLQGIGLYCMNAFMEPLTEANGWSRLAINNSLTLAVFIGQVAMPIAAVIANKVSLRLLMTLGALFGGIAISGMGMTSNIYVYTLCLVILWICTQFCGGVVGNALMANWFFHYRGIALGIANSGGSFGGIILPMLTLFIIHQSGLQNAYLILGVFTFLLGPLCWIFVRRMPHQLNLHPDGANHEPEPEVLKHINTSVKVLIKRPAVWYIGLAFGLTLMIGAGITSQLKPRMSDLGITPYTAMLFTSIAAFFGTIAKFFWGMVNDRTNAIFTSRMVMLVLSSSFLLLLLPHSSWNVAIFAFCFSLGSGGLWVCLPAVVASYFGPANFLGVYRIISIFIILRCFGFSIMGLSHEYTGSYDMSDLCFFILCILSLGLTMLLNQNKSLEKLH